MSEIYIPFMEQFRDVMLTGRKTCTSRTSRYGQPGDTFTAFGVRFMIKKVSREALSNVAYLLHKAEGFEDVKGFVACWEQIHPRRGYRGADRVYLHLFERIA
jgi:hypothetical protein